MKRTTASTQKPQTNTRKAKTTIKRAAKPKVKDKATDKTKAKTPTKATVAAKTPAKRAAQTNVKQAARAAAKPVSRAAATTVSRAAVTTVSRAAAKAPTKARTSAGVRSRAQAAAKTLAPKERAAKASKAVKVAEPAKVANAASAIRGAGVLPPPTPASALDQAAQTLIQANATATAQAHASTPDGVPSPDGQSPLSRTRPWDTKQSRMIALLSAPAGATMAQMMALTGWAAHTVRGMISGSLRQRLGLQVQVQRADGQRVYRIVVPHTHSAPDALQGDSGCAIRSATKAD